MCLLLPFFCLDLPAQNSLRVEYLSMFKVHVTKFAGNWGFPDTYRKILNRDIQFLCSVYYIHRWFIFFIFNKNTKQSSLFSVLSVWLETWQKVTRISSPSTTLKWETYKYFSRSKSNIIKYNMSIMNHLVSSFYTKS